MPKTEINTKPLTADCEGCGAPDSLYYPGWDEHLCPECSAIRDRWQAAERHLSELLKATVSTWASHWEAKGLSRQVSGETIEFLDLLVDLKAMVEKGDTAATVGSPVRAPR